MTRASIEDRLDIIDLFARYARALDEGDVDGIASCFSHTAEVDSPIVGKYAGREGIRKFAARYSQFRKQRGQTRHFITNIEARVEGNTANAHAYLMCCITRDGKSEVIPPSVYECVLTRIDGQWLFERRVVRQDAPFILSGI